MENQAKPIQRRLPKLFIVGDIFVHSESPFGVKLTLVKDGQQVESKISCDNGIFRFNLDFNATYQLKATKEGYLEKIIDFNTSVPELPANNDIFRFGIKLFKANKIVPKDLMKKTCSAHKIRQRNI